MREFYKNPQLQLPWFDELDQHIFARSLREGAPFIFYQIRLKGTQSYYMYRTKQGKASFSSNTRAEPRNFDSIEKTEEMVRKLSATGMQFSCGRGVVIPEKPEFEIVKWVDVKFTKVVS